MANPEHLAILGRGIEVWNDWRQKNWDIKPDLGGAHLSFAKLNEADFSGGDLSHIDLGDAKLQRAQLFNANLKKAHLAGADLYLANLDGADLSEAELSHTKLDGATLIEAKLAGANLFATHLNRADLSRTDLTGANLLAADLREAHLVETNFENANLSHCFVYGISAWAVRLAGATQSSLTIDTFGDSTISVDNLEVAQFIYLLLNNEKIRDVINILTMKAVLILGRFGEHKIVLEAVRDEVRRRGYLPIVFDFDKPDSRNLTETVRTLAHLSHFIIADLTDPSSIPQELYAIIPTLAVAVQPVIESGQREYSMFADLPTTYHWVLPTVEYKDTNDLLVLLGDKVIAPAEAKAKELERR